jgi:hypothetical protein
MRYVLLFSLFIFSIFLSSCVVDEVIPNSSGEVDGAITLEEAEAQDYNLRTPGYDIQVAIREDVNADVDNILDILDERAANFLECQFMTNPDIGAQEFQIPNGDIVPPLSELRVFVVPINFECDAVDKNVCAGIYYFGADLIIIAKEGFARCGTLPLWKHEIGHRYGMAANHSNQSDFEPCIDPPDCDIDLIDIVFD